MQKLKENMMTFMISPATKRALKVVAAEDDMSISEYVRRLIDSDPRINARAKMFEHKVGKLPVISTESQ